MIDYDPHRWWTYFHYLKGSMIRKIIYRVMACVAWSAAVVALHQEVRAMEIPATVHTLAGISLSLLLVFRTNSSYDRFWEGRKLWGGIVNETRNLARAAGVLLREDAPLYATLVRWTATFPYASAAALRGSVDLGPQAAELPAEQVAQVRGAQHVPLAVARRMSTALDEGRRRGHYTE